MTDLKDFFLNYSRKSKNKTRIKILKFFLKILLWPISIPWMIRRLQDLLYYTTKAKTLREWWFSSPPHYSDLGFGFFTTYKTKNSFWTSRGVYSRQAIPRNGTVLDIGCGDGFYDYYYYSNHASKIDAIDIELSAIKNAKKYHSDPKINYYKLDAVNEDFPNEKYDAIIMDGSIGHFKNEDVEVMMNKILKSMTNDSIFVGSEAMETKENMSEDHFQVFPTVNHMKNFLLKYFKNVRVWSEDEKVYSQVYFQCTKDEDGFKKLTSKIF